jgi:hypothetical protein
MYFIDTGYRLISLDMLPPLRVVLPRHALTVLYLSAFAGRVRLTAKEAEILDS